MDWRPELFAGDLFREATDYLRQDAGVSQIRVFDPGLLREYIPLTEAIAAAAPPQNQGGRMKRFLNSIAAGVRAMRSGPAGDQYDVAGRPVRCPHCGGEDFLESRTLLNTAGLTFLKLEWANRTATTLACVECGRIEWFLTEPEQRS